METYRDRGHRRLDARTYVARCSTCIWGRRIPVEMIIDPWNPSFRNRFETFYYGPKSCAFYQPSPARKVPGRKGMTYTEEDWVDEDATAHRGPDDRGSEMQQSYDTHGNKAAADILERAQGCLLGQLAGDAMGSPVEYRSPARSDAQLPTRSRTTTCAPPPIPSASGQSMHWS
jgi:hypothetical protein